MTDFNYIPVAGRNFSASAFSRSNRCLRIRGYCQDFYRFKYDCRNVGHKSRLHYAARHWRDFSHEEEICRWIVFPYGSKFDPVGHAWLSMTGNYNRFKPSE